MLNLHRQRLVRPGPFTVLIQKQAKVTPDVDYAPEHKDSADSISKISDFPIQAPEPSSPGNVAVPPLLESKYDSISCSKSD